MLIRPHPQNAGQWQNIDFSAYGDVAIWPRDPSVRVDADSKAAFFDSIFHSTGIVGINTSALIEAGIIGRPVFTVLDPEYRSSQDGTLHFRYLLSVSGGLLKVANDLDEHVGQLGATLTESAHEASALAFVGSFVRPGGVDRPATPILANALQDLAGLETRPDRAPFWALAARPGLFVVALLAHLAWTGLRSDRLQSFRRQVFQRTEWRAGVPTSAPSPVVQARSMAATDGASKTPGSALPR